MRLRPPRNPPQTAVNNRAVLQRVVDQSAEVDAEFRLQLTAPFRDDWERRGKHYSYWAVAAGLVIAVNAGLSFLHLVSVTSAEAESPNHHLQLTGDARDGQ